MDKAEGFSTTPLCTACVTALDTDDTNWLSTTNCVATASVSELSAAPTLRLPELMTVASDELMDVLMAAKAEAADCAAALSVAKVPGEMAEPLSTAAVTAAAKAPCNTLGLSRKFPPEPL